MSIGLQTIRLFWICEIYAKHEPQFMRSSLIQLAVKDRESISTSNTSHERTAANRSVASTCIARNMQLMWMLFMCHLRALMICFMLALPISQFQFMKCAKQFQKQIREIAC